ncbi:MAG: hypothetical protein K0R39_2378 [Symbiobacteriaceae bacterium]|jgi:hypothetical protein|nr:hypothetical protein [Symbiobacteriaceae bacterium]
MLVSIGLLLAQFVPAFLALDLVFRFMDLSPGALRRELRRYGLLFAFAAVDFGLAGAWFQWRADGVLGLVAAAGNWVPWWLLWRFGLRKQLTHLFKDDGGKDQDATKPDL